jgi:hypothetical protein
MKAKTQYGDFEGSVSADISDLLSEGNSNIEKIGKFFELDEKRFKIVGLSIFGTSNFGVSLICVDNEKSTNEKEHIVSMMCNTDDDEGEELLDNLFKRFHIVLYPRNDKEYSILEPDEEVNFSDYHKN